MKKKVNVATKDLFLPLAHLTGGFWRRSHVLPRADYSPTRVAKNRLLYYSLPAKMAGSRVHKFGTIFKR